MSLEIFLRSTFRSKSCCRGLCRFQKPKEDQLNEVWSRYEEHTLLMKYELESEFGALEKTFTINFKVSDYAKYNKTILLP